jgi:hypothetical protein
MAQWDFAVSWDDIWAQLEAIAKRPGTTLVHDLWYKDDKPVIYSNVDAAARKAIMARPSLFIQGQDFTPFPILLHAVDEEETPTFVITRNEGGPLLELFIRGEYEANETLVIPTSMLTYHDEYLNPASSQWEPAPPESKAAYKDIQTLMKRSMVRHKGQRGFVWIGRRAFDMFNKGRAKISFFGLKP